MMPAPFVIGDSDRDNTPSKNQKVKRENRLESRWVGGNVHDHDHCDVSRRPWERNALRDASRRDSVKLNTVYFCN